MSLVCVHCGKPSETPSCQECWEDPGKLGDNDSWEGETSEPKTSREMELEKSVLEEISRGTELVSMMMDMIIKVAEFGVTIDIDKDKNVLVYKTEGSDDEQR